MKGHVRLKNRPKCSYLLPIKNRVTWSDTIFSRLQSSQQHSLSAALTQLPCHSLSLAPVREVKLCRSISEQPSIKWMTFDFCWTWNWKTRRKCFHDSPSLFLVSLDTKQWVGRYFKFELLALIIALPIQFSLAMVATSPIPFSDKQITEVRLYPLPPPLYIQLRPLLSSLYINTKAPYNQLQLKPLPLNT